MKEDYCVRLKELRLEKGLSQKKLAELIGCSVYMLNKWEKCLATPELYDFILLSCHLDASSDYIAGKTKIRKVKNVKYDACPDENRYITLE